MAKPRTAAEEETPLAPEVMAGAQLRAARESQGLTAQDVAARLHLDTRTIDSLEADAYGELPNETYVRGYIRTYARLVNVDAEPLLASYGRHAQQGPVLTPFASMPEPQARASDFPVKAVTYLVVATLVALLVLWSWQTHNLSALVTFAMPKWGQDNSAQVAAKAKPTVATAKPAAPASTPAPATPHASAKTSNGTQAPQINYTYPVIDNSGGPAREDTQSAPASGSAAGETGAESSAAAETKTQAAAAGPSNPAPAAAPAQTQTDNGTAGSEGGEPAATATAATGSATSAAASSADATATNGAGTTPVVTDGQGLVLQVSNGDSWIGISDSTGKKLYFNLAREGSRISVQGELPYDVKIGRASAVTILYQNKPLDVSAYTHQGVAHFKLTADGPAAP